VSDRLRPNGCCLTSILGLSQPVGIFMRQKPEDLPASPCNLLIWQHCPAKFSNGTILAALKLEFLVENNDDLSAPQKESEPEKSDADPRPDAEKNEPNSTCGAETENDSPPVEPSSKFAPAAHDGHLTPKAAEALSCDVEERVAFAKTDRWIPYVAAKEVLKQAIDMINAPPKLPMGGMLVLGRSRNGKSTISRRLESMFRPIVGPDGNVKAPAIRVELPPGANVSLFWETMILGCGSVCRTSDHWQVKRAQACSMFKSLEPSALIIDEFHNLLLGSARDARYLLGELKWLSNNFSMTVILFGIEDASNLLEYDPQMTGRFDQIALPWWKGNAELPSLIDTFEAILPLPERSDLNSPEMMRLIDEKYDGTIGSLARVLQEAATLAIRAGRPRIDAKILSKVKGNTELSRRAERGKL
jgi:hypothetical protein